MLIHASSLLSSSAVCALMYCLLHQVVVQQAKPQPL